MAGTYTVNQAVSWTGPYNGGTVTVAFAAGTLIPNAEQQWILDNYLVPEGLAVNPAGQTGQAAPAGGSPAAPLAAGLVLTTNGSGGAAFQAPTGGSGTQANVPLVVNVTDAAWGFVNDPTGLVDQHAAMTALNAALAAAGTAAKKTVFFPAGTYMSSVTFQPPSNTTVYGEGASTVLLMAPASVDPTASSLPCWVNGATDVTVRDLTLDGNFANVAKSGGFILPSTALTGVTLNAGITSTAGGATSTLSGTTTNLPTTFPFFVQLGTETCLATWNGTVLTLTARGVNGTTAATHAGGAAVAQTVVGGVASPTTNPVYDARIAKWGPATPKNYYRNGTIDAGDYLATGLPLRITNSQRVTVRGCRLQNSVGPGVLTDATSVDGCADIMVRDCFVKLTWDNGIYFHVGTVYASAIGNTTVATQYCGIAGIFANKLTVTDNQVRDVGPSTSDSGGIILGGCAEFVISGNLVHDSMFEGIEVEGSVETGITGGPGNGYEVRCSNGLIEGNVVTACNLPTFLTTGGQCTGIQSIGSDNVTVRGNQVVGCDAGINAAVKTTNMTIDGNTIAGTLGNGTQVGNSPDVLGTVVRGNRYVGCAWANGDDTILGWAPALYEGNHVTGGARHGLSLRTWTGPNGSGYKTDRVIGNQFWGNGHNNGYGWGIDVQVGPAGVVIADGNKGGNTGFDPLVCTDAQVTAGQTTVTSAQAKFAAGDAGVIVEIEESAGTGTAYGTIASVAGTTATLTMLAGTSITRTSTAQNPVTITVLRGESIFADGVLASGNQLTSASAGGFTSADVGKTVRLWSASYLGGQPDQANASAPPPFNTSTISSVSAGTATLSTSPGAASPVLFSIVRDNPWQQYLCNKTSGAVIYTANKSYGHSVSNWTGFNQLDTVEGNQSFGDATPTLDHNSGVGTVSTASSSTTVNHGLGFQPALQDIDLTPNGPLVGVTQVAVTAVTATTFTVTTYNAAGTATAPTTAFPFSWNAMPMARL